MSRKTSTKSASGSPSTSTIGFEAKLWLTASRATAANLFSAVVAELITA